MQSLPLNEKRESVDSVASYHIYFTEESLNQVADSIEALNDDELHFRLHPTSNTIAWDAWHIFRTVDNLVHFVFERDEPVWIQQELWKRWNLPKVDQGTAQTPEEAWAMRFPPGPELADYGRDVLAAVMPRLAAMSDEYLQARHQVFPWGNVTRLFVLGKVVTHSSKHLGYIAGAIGVLGKQGPSF